MPSLISSNLLGKGKSVLEKRVVYKGNPELENIFDIEIYKILRTTRIKKLKF